MATVGSRSGMGVKIQMSSQRKDGVPAHVDESDLTELLEYHREEIRGEVEERGNSDSAPFYIRADDGKRMLAVGAVFIAGVLGGALLIPDPMSALFIGGLVAAAGSLVLTREGVAWRRGVTNLDADNQQQQQGVSNSEPTRVCSHCGWQNPVQNNYCHDCGGELGAE